MCDKVDAARLFAAEAHRGQQYGALPYTAHLEAVAKILEEAGAPWEVVAAGWLHDILEDTPTSAADLVVQFGERVADLVEAVTGDPQRPRVERFGPVYEKIRVVGPDAALLKLADRIANVEHSRATGSTMLKRYRREQASFEAGVRPTGGADALWDRLARALS